MAFQAEVFLWDRDWEVHAGSTHCVNSAQSRVWPLGFFVYWLLKLLQGQRIPRKQWVRYCVQNLVPRVVMVISSISLVMQLPGEFFGRELVTMATLFSPQESQPSLCMLGKVAFLMPYVCHTQLSTKEEKIIHGDH